MIVSLNEVPAIRIALLLSLTCQAGCGDDLMTSNTYPTTFIDDDSVARCIRKKEPLDCLTLNCSSDTWYKGNTHTHSNTSPDGDSIPEDVVRWYYDKGYHFLVLTDHDTVTDLASIGMPEDKRGDFVLIPGEEMTGSEGVFTTAMNIQRTIPLDELLNSPKSVAIQDHVDRVLSGGGIPILAALNYHEGIGADDILPVDNLYLFEVLNGQLDLYPQVDHRNYSLEELWDELLTSGRILYGVGTDDSHFFQEWREDLSNPGRAWTMIRADELSVESIGEALLAGLSYVSSGVVLKSLSLENDTLTIIVDPERTGEEVTASLFGGRIEGSDRQDGYSIDFIGPNGLGIKSLSPCLAANFTLSPKYDYVRAKITFRKPHGQSREQEVFYALTQPIFNDGR